MPRKKVISIPAPAVDPNTRFSRRVVAEVLGVKESVVNGRLTTLGIKTGGKGLTAMDAKRVRDYRPMPRGGNPYLIGGTPDQLRYALATM